LRTAFLAIIGIFLACVFFSAYRIYTVNGAVDGSKLPVAALIGAQQSILVFSPHPDDETLGCGGLLYDAHERGAQTHVIFMTCGDGFEAGAARSFNKVKLRPVDYKRYGEMRLGETINALETLGLKRSDITYLGFPDGGTGDIWNKHWSAQDPYKSSFSNSNKVFYPEAYRVGAPFCGEELLREVLELLNQIRPTDVYVTHPNDDHKDHTTASAMMTLAVNILHQSNQPWARNIRIHYFIVHRGDWPIPQGSHEASPLNPPARLIGCDTVWSKFLLTHEQENRVKMALKCYKSQQLMMHRFMVTFVRDSEIFGDIPRQQQKIEINPSGFMAPILTALPSDWRDCKPFSIDPVNDTVLLSWQKGADIRAVWAKPVGKDLYLRMDLNGSLLPEVQYSMSIRAVGYDGSSSAQSTVIQLTPRKTLSGEQEHSADSSMVSWQDNSVEAHVPLDKIGVNGNCVLFIEGMTKMAGALCDRTGPREMQIEASKPGITGLY
jgi:LmbE family N-acetylglucosaminyl deacetylase